MKTHEIWLLQAVFDNDCYKYLTTEGKLKASDTYNKLLGKTDD